MQVIYDKEVLNDKLRMANALQSHAIVQGCLSTIKKECEKFGITQNVNLIFITTRRMIQVNINEDNANYEAIMSSKHTSISDLETIRYWRVQEIILPDYDTEIDIYFNFNCPLPADDLLTLRMLGKVHTKHCTDSYTNESIYCEIPGMPF